MASQLQQLRLQELGDFLRTRRARLAPEQVGLPRGSRRRAPGLRRFEHLTFPVFDAPELKVTVYTPLEEADTPRKLYQLLDGRLMC